MVVAESAYKLDRINDAVAAVRKEELVVVVDDSDRENYGELIAAATERMAFIIVTRAASSAPRTRPLARRWRAQG